MSDLRLEMVAKQLLALRASLEAAQAQLEAVIATVDWMLDGQEPPPCAHPRKENVGTMGAPSWECPDCGARWDEQLTSLQ